MGKKTEKATGGEQHGRKTYEPPSQAEIDEYRNLQYPKWMENLKDWIKSTENRLKQISGYVPLLYRISNEGEAPLANCVVEFDTYGEATFCTPDTADEMENLLTIPDPPAPPSPPRGKWRSASFGLDSLLASLTRFNQIQPIPHIATFPIARTVPRPRDKHSFYWKGHRPSEEQKNWAYECEELRHQVEPEEFKLCLYLPPEYAECEVTVRCRVTGTNQQNPYLNYLKIRLQYNERRIVDELSRIVDREHG